MSYKVIKIKDYISYTDALELQLKLYKDVEDGLFEGIILVLEHKPVLTMGIRTDAKNLLVSEEYLTSQGVELYRSDRGGDITFHGPGQIVVYPIFNLKKMGLKLKDYMHNLELSIMDMLGKYGITAHQRNEYPGVWIEDTKVCAIGVKVRKFITYHGLAINITTDKNYFNLINPCGITNFKVSSMKDFVEDVNIETVKDQIITSFETIYNIKTELVEISDIK